MQADAEHQQHDADLRELRREMHIGDETGRRRPDQNTRQEVTNQGRNPEALGDETQDQGDAKTGGNRGDQ